MTDLTELDSPADEKEGFAEDKNAGKRRPPVGIPSNEVYARVGDTVLRAAQDGVRRGLPPQEIIREIRVAHGVHLNVGEFRLLLASRRLPQ